MVDLLISDSDRRLIDLTISLYERPNFKCTWDESMQMVPGVLLSENQSNFKVFCIVFNDQLLFVLMYNT